MTRSPYELLEERFRRLAHLRGALAVLEWDSATMMPSGGAGSRAEQVAALRVVAHGVLADPTLAELLAAAEAASGALDPWQRANLTEMRHEWRNATALDERLVEAFSRATSACEMVWRKARARNSFATLRPHLETVVTLVREIAAAKAAAFGLEPYDALLESYESGVRCAMIEPLFAELESYLPGLLAEVLARQESAPPLPLEGPFPIGAQRALGRDLMALLGFDFEHGRLDVSLHPFTGGVADDVRITTRYHKDRFIDALMGVLHETGHALYERGLPEGWRQQPVGKARGMAIHESQSLLIEMQVCRSREFIELLAPRLRAAFGTDGPAWQSENLRRHLQRVARGLIRVDADEVTYPLHIILRYRLEKALLGGDLAVADLPGAWRAEMARLVGVTPPDDKDGCLQDIHWPDGDFGYFPTYTLGAIAAAQLFDSARAADPDIAPGIGRGDFAPLMAWLRANVHRQGRRYTADELLRRVTGRSFDATTFRRHLQARYLA